MASQPDNCAFCDNPCTSRSWQCDTCLVTVCSNNCAERVQFAHEFNCRGSFKMHMKQKTTETVKGKELSKVTCRFFGLGTCRKGDQCIFLHAKDKFVCEYYLEGCCRFGKKCTNLHPGEKDSVQGSPRPAKIKNVVQGEAPVCIQFQKGNCDYGNKCNYRHFFPSESVPPRLQKKNLLAPATKSAGQPIKSPIRPAKPAVKKKPEVEEVKYVAICTFFNRGACAYGDKCHKAHEKLPLYKKDLTPEMVLKKVVSVVEEKGDTATKYKSDSQTSGYYEDEEDYEHGQDEEDYEHGQDEDEKDEVEEDEIFMSDSEYSDEGSDEGISNKNSRIASQTLMSQDQKTSNIKNPVSNFNNTAPIPAIKKNSPVSPTIKKNPPVAPVIIKNILVPPVIIKTPVVPPVITINPPNLEIKKNHTKETNKIPTPPVKSPKTNSKNNNSSAYLDSNRNPKPSKLKTNYLNPFEVLKPESEDSDESNSDLEDENDFEDEGLNVNSEGGNKTNGVCKKEKKEKLKLQKMVNTKILVDNLRYEGNHQFEKKEFKNSIKLYTQAIAKCGPNNPDPKLYNNRAAAFMQDENFRCAYNDALKCVDFDQKNEKALVRIVKCCVVLGFVEEGLEYLTRTRLDPKEVAGYQKKLQTISNYRQEFLRWAEADEFGSAEVYADKALKICYQSAEFRVYKAAMLALQKKSASALEELKKLDTKDSCIKTSWFYFAQGLINFYENDLNRALSGFGEAKRELKQAENWHEKVASMHSCLQNGIKHSKSKEFPEAISCFSDGLALGEENSKYKLEIFKQRSTVFSKLNDYSSAVLDLTSALQISPRDIKLLQMRGLVYLEWSEYDLALQDFLAVDIILPNSKINQSNIDKVSRKRKEQQKQEKHKERVKEKEEKKKSAEAERRQKEQERQQKEQERRQKQKERRDQRQQQSRKIHEDSNNFYEVLGVSQDISSKDLKQEFYKQAKIFHPDKNSGATAEEKQKLEKKMKEIAQAYHVLSDPERRKLHDMKLRRGYDQHYCEDCGGDCCDDDDDDEYDDYDGFSYDDLFQFIYARYFSDRRYYF